MTKEQHTAAVHALAPFAGFAKHYLSPDADDGDSVVLPIRAEFLKRAANALAMLESSEPPPYPGCDPVQRCLHGGLWGGRDCPYCDGYNRVKINS